MTIPTAADPPAAPQLPSAQTVSSNSVCLILKKGRLGVSRKAQARHIEPNAPLTIAMAGGAVLTDAQVDSVRVSKRILKSEKLAAVGKCDSEMRQFMKARALPSLFKGGIWRIPNELLEEITTGLDARIALRNNELVPAFLDEYEAACEAAPTDLGSLYDPADYPPKARVAALFYCDYDIVTFETPSALRKIKKDLFAKEQAKMAVKLQAEAEIIQAGLRQAFLQLIQGMHTALEPGDDGKKKRFHASKLEHLSQFLNLFRARNITDDTELDQLVGQAQALIDGVDAEMIRDSEELKQVLGDEFEKLAVAVAPLAVSTRRLINFDDDDGE
jgi:hypothetical protein